MIIFWIHRLGFWAIERQRMVKKKMAFPKAQNEVHKCFVLSTTEIHSVNWQKGRNKLETIHV